jgi:glycosyl transferase family 25
MSTNKQIGIDGIYVVHAINGYELHEKRLIEILKEQYGLDFEFVTEGDTSLWPNELISSYFSIDIQKKLSPGVLSCTLNHILSYERMVKNNDKYAIIFENDPFFIGNFPEKIKRLINEANNLEEGFLISIENTTLEFPPWRETKKGKYLYEANRGRCAGAYIIDQLAARKILNDLKSTKCDTVIDWWLNSLVNRSVVKMYWAHPALTEQGSHNGKMSSTISTKSKGRIRRFKWLAQKYYKMYILRWFK